MKFFFFIFVWIGSLSFADATDTPIRIQIEGLRSGQGQVCLSVFSKASPQGFPGDSQKARAEVVVPLQGKTQLTVETEDLPDGSYAVAILHDENSDFKLNTTLGLPREGFGFSNNPTVYFGAPSMEKALFEHSSQSGVIKVRMKYLF